MAATGDLAISAGHDVFLQGSQVAGTNDVTLAALGNVNLTASQDTQMSSGYNQKHESGFGTGGGIGISVGSKTQTDTANTTQVTHTSSTVGSLGGNLNLSAGKDLHVTGSDLVAAQNLTGTGTNVTLDAAADTQHHDETHEVKQSGFTLALKAPVIDAVSNTVDQAHAASRSQDNRAAALHGMAAASGAMDSSGAAGTALGELASGQMPSARIELSYGSSHSKRTYAEDSTTHRGSKVTAGGTAAFVAKGESTPGSGNLTIAGSNVNANDVILAAKNQVSLVNTTDTSSTRSSNESGSASVGISYGTQGFGISASMSKAHGNGSSDSATQNNTHVSAASTATIISGGDTNITGSNLNGRQVSATIGGNLNMASVQDTMSSTAHQESSGGGFTLSQGGGSASVSHTSANASGRYAGVNEQTGIQAGDGGFDISVKGHTGLNGAYLAGSADASKNTLTTGTLTFSDIGNTSNYKASSSGFSAGVSTGDGGANYSTHGNTSGKNTGGGTPMLSQNDSGNDSATTRSSISAGTISVTDAASQRQDITSLNRDASNTNGTIARLPDVNNLLERQADMMAAASAAGEAVSRRIGDFAQSKYDAAKARGDQAGMEAWKEGGTARAGMQAAGVAMVTGLAGGNAPGSAAGAGIASIAAGKLNEISGAIAGSNPTGSADINTALGNIVANAIATGAGAAVGGNAGAVAGGNVDRFNRQLHEEEKVLAKKLADDSGGKYTEADVVNQLALMDMTKDGKTESGGVRVAVGDQPQDGTDWKVYGTNKDGQTVWAQSLGAGDPDLQTYIAKNASGGGVSYQPTTTGSNLGLVRAPDFVNFQIDYFVGSVWGTFSRDGNAFFGVGVNKSIPNSLGASASAQLGWLNRSSVSPGQVNQFLSGYSGNGSTAFATVGGGVVYSPDNGTATTIGIGAGVNLGNTRNPAAVGTGNTYDQGKTGWRW
ncbi:hemagglutinin repeat-containing protein [Paraburkholderia bonniea]|nr:hemagglutinin repeat-containing protein [Paraburkholderia bonniea]WJF90298.1 hemagglutinin repeat-containing protein [Paraburkholderia bonniea]WJF93613.1 hemagglutinin repeat-containing protein [Paraburkholderia bonniea]